MRRSDPVTHRSPVQRLNVFKHCLYALTARSKQVPRMTCLLEEYHTIFWSSLRCHSRATAGRVVSVNNGLNAILGNLTGRKNPELLSLVGWGRALTENGSTQRSDWTWAKHTWLDTTMVRDYGNPPCPEKECQSLTPDLQVQTSLCHSNQPCGVDLECPQRPICQATRSKHTPPDAAERSP
jgi:hypothetical protein